MKIFKDDLPIYLQLRKHIEELILNRSLSEEEMIPSLRTMARDYSLNPITVANAIGALVEEGILLKKRGIGVSVAPDARALIIKSRGKSFITEILDETLRDAQNLEIPRQIIIERLNAIYGEEK
ncbi:MAG: GntR family transcriptional regulator [Candidatus Cloacimonadaceae bacterium]|nr:GntR family transcriptional regulator [Candidatus Cloacimonadaceae bacterium]